MHVTLWRLGTVPFIKKRVLRPGKEDLIKILQSSEIQKPPEIRHFTEEFRHACDAMETGSVAYVYKEPETGMSIETVGWKGKDTLRAYVPKNERKEARENRESLISGENGDADHSNGDVDKTNGDSKVAEDHSNGDVDNTNG